jgi:hypothetical protein
MTWSGIEPEPPRHKTGHYGATVSEYCNTEKVGVAATLWRSILLGHEHGFRQFLWKKSGDRISNEYTRFLSHIFQCIYCLSIGRYIGFPTRRGQYCGRSQYRPFWPEKYICTCVLFRTVSEIELFHCTDEEHAIASHELQSALMLTVEFSKIYYTR